MSEARPSFVIGQLERYGDKRLFTNCASDMGVKEVGACEIKHSTHAIIGFVIDIDLTLEIILMYSANFSILLRK